MSCLPLLVGRKTSHVKSKHFLISNRQKQNSLKKTFDNVENLSRQNQNRTFQILYKRYKSVKNMLI